MKKEILFRGFHPDENGPQEITLNGKKIRGLWVQGWYCGATCDSFFAKARKSAQILDSELIWYEVIPETVGQYTGLTDQNRNRIFEDDVVDCWSEGVNAQGTVQQRQDGLWIIYPAWQKHITWGLCPDEYSNTTVQVIGNIFSNPELIEGGEQE